MSKFWSKQQGYLFGHQSSDGEEVWVSPEHRKAHMHVIGASGFGKSKFLEHLIRLDLSNPSIGACVIDPHGLLVDDIMNYLSHRAPDLAKRVVLFEPGSQTDTIIGFNPIPRDFDNIPTAIDDLIASILFAWGESEQTLPRIRTQLFNIFYPVLANQLTLVEALPMISIESRAERERLLKRVVHQAILHAWQTFEKANSTQKLQLLEGPQNRLMRLLSNEHMRLILSQRENSLNLRQIMDDRKILLVSLRSHNRIADDHLRMLGIMILSEIYRVGMQRNERLRPPPFHVYVDEFSEFVTPVVGKALAQIRKKNVYFTLAHQNLAQLNNQQMDFDLLDTVLGNCRLKVAFGGMTTKDADVISKLHWTGHLPLDEMKHRQWVTKFRPVESTRTSHNRSGSESESTSHSESRGESWSHTLADGTTDTTGWGVSESEMNGWGKSDSTSQGTNTNWSRGQTAGTNYSNTKSSSHTSANALGKTSSMSHGTQQNRSSTEGSSDTTSEANTHSSSRSSSHSESSSSSSSSSESRNDGHNTTFVPGGAGGTTTAVHSLSDGKTTASNHSSSSSYSSNSSESESHSKTTSKSHTDNRSKTEGSSASTNTTKGMSHSKTVSDAEGQSSSRGGNSSNSSSRGVGTSSGKSHAESVSGSTSYTDSRSGSHADSHTESKGTGGSTGSSDSTSQSQGWSEGETTGPFMEMHEFKEVSSTQFYSFQEQEYRKKGELMNLGTGVAWVKVDNSMPVELQTVHIPDVHFIPKYSYPKLARTEAKIYAANAGYYAPRQEVMAAAIDRQEQMFGSRLQLDEGEWEEAELVEPDDPADVVFRTP